MVPTRCDDHESKWASSNSLSINLTVSQLQSTVVVPAVSTGAGYHATWPGLENDSGEFVYQNVISDSNGAGSWQFWIEYCCEYDVSILSTCSSTNPNFSPNFDSTPITGQRLVCLNMAWLMN